METAGIFAESVALVIGACILFDGMVVLYMALRSKK